MEGGDKELKTVECLRARLAAERQASKIAKHHSLLLHNKLVEIEKMLEQEIKLRNKAEKRLTFLNKKLIQSPTTSDFSDTTNQSSTEMRPSPMSKSSVSEHEDCASSVVDCCDDSLALVPLPLASSSSSSRTIVDDVKNNPVNENVAQVLDSLKYIRETIQSSLEMRCLVR